MASKRHDGECVVVNTIVTQSSCTCWPKSAKCEELVKDKHFCQSTKEAAPETSVPFIDIARSRTNRYTETMRFFGFPTFSARRDLWTSDATTATTATTVTTVTTVTTATAATTAATEMTETAEMKATTWTTVLVRVLEVRMGVRYRVQCGALRVCYQS